MYPWLVSSLQSCAACVPSDTRLHRRQVNDCVSNYCGHLPCQLSIKGNARDTHMRSICWVLEEARPPKQVVLLCIYLISCNFAQKQTSIRGAEYHWSCYTQ